MNTPSAPSFDDAEGYTGSAVLRSHGGSSVPVEVDLRGHFEPIDGAFHWYGRVATNASVDQAHRSGDRVRVETPHGAANGKLTDVDPWGRFRLSGVGAPPFPVDRS